VRRRGWLRGMVLTPLATAAIFAAWALSKGRTPPIRDERGRIDPGSVASLERARIGGIEQALLIRGLDRRNPVLVFLHGGPGMPAMFLAHRCQRPLEQRFVVVNWDQRGAGKSYGPHVPPETMTVERFLADAAEVIGLLQRRFDVDRVYLVGHSWGSYLGVLLAHRYPERVRAYVGVGQVADEERGRALANDFLRRRFRESGNEEGERELAEKGGAVREQWLFRFGGVLHGETSFWPLLRAGLLSPEYTLADVRNVPRGPSFAAKHMRWDAIDGPLIERVTRLEVPVYFFLGRHDWDTPSVLAAEYLDRLAAPRRRLVWFEESAHFPFFEEPEKFAREMGSVAAENEGPHGTE
jgi:pimeloyl-ACP methyl ester carboxylesterase